MRGDIDYEIRQADASDEPFLWEMLYQSIYVEAGQPPYPREVLQRPEVAKYVKGWGRAGDLGFVAVEAKTGRLMGAAWCRLLNGEEKGFAYVDERTPELGVALLPEDRGRGIGTALLTRLLEEGKRLYPAISLSVSPNNPAVRLYRRLGFETVEIRRAHPVMRRELDGSSHLKSNTQDVWQSAPARPSLAEGVAHVWRVSLEQPPEVYEQLSQTLSPDEHARAERFHFEKDRTRFVVARAGLRSILSRYTGLPPARLRFSYGAQGKPELSLTTEQDALRFNLSHAGTLALCAVTGGREIGVDVESVRADFASDEIAERFFSPREVAALRELPADARTRAFFNCWTRKEAYIKALGMGLTCPLDSFAVSLAEEDAAALVWSAEGAQEVERWTMMALPVGTDYAAAVVVEGRVDSFNLWHWKPLELRV